MKKISAILILVLMLFSESFAGKRILFIGDSVTDGAWGGSGGSAMPSAQRNHTDLNHIYGHSYMMLCASYFESEYPEAGYQFFNRGISGDDLLRIEKRCKEDIIDVNPDVLSILVGINDVFYYMQNETGKPFDFASWEARYRSLLDRVIAHKPDVSIMLCTPFAANVGRYEKENEYQLCNSLVSELDSIVCRIAKDYGAAIVRYDKLFPTLKGNPKHWIWDGIHPTPAGHKKMADLWISVCKEKGYLK